MKKLDMKEKVRGQRGISTGKQLHDKWQEEKIHKAENVTIIMSVEKGG